MEDWGESLHDRPYEAVRSLDADARLIPGDRSEPVIAFATVFETVSEQREQFGGQLAAAHEFGREGGQDAGVLGSAHVPRQECNHHASLCLAHEFPDLSLTHTAIPSSRVLSNSEKSPRSFMMC